MLASEVSPLLYGATESEGAGGGGKRAKKASSSLRNAIAATLMVGCVCAVVAVSG
eukprot:CAMPEP_0197599770 /NCGR_PEP_ID=MMETSP1326-20131121/32055_1 /TAXON_ID=1155430 /ORGANISM="Genus nov. species nov., Strain RCC2288" /LENGTH=54 /DNA_ID=CAMNT_0043166783 /DNA_START=6 /DNA_END=166 /DNA_ORIENTATION=-